MEPPDPPHDPLGSILTRHLPRLQAFIRLRAGAAFRRRESATDLIQSACCELIQQAQRDDRMAAMLGDEEWLRRWLYLRTLRKVRDRIRFHRAGRRDIRREVRLPDSTTHASNSCRLAYGTVLTPSRVVMGRECAARFESAFDRLPAPSREVITLAKLAGMSHAAIAEELDITRKDVANALHRGLLELSWMLSETDPGTADE